jgi:hypothetical protein
MLYRAAKKTLAVEGGNAQKLVVEMDFKAANVRSFSMVSPD